MLTDLQYLCRTTFYETFSDSTDEEDMRKFLAETYSAEKLSAELANSESVTFIAYKNGTPLGYLKLNIANQRIGNQHDPIVVGQRHRQCAD